MNTKMNTTVTFEKIDEWKTLDLIVDITDEAREGWEEHESLITATAHTLIEKQDEEGLRELMHTLGQAWEGSEDGLTLTHMSNELTVTVLSYLGDPVFVIKLANENWPKAPAEGERSPAGTATKRSPATTTPAAAPSAATN